MTVVYTNLGNTREAARRIRFDPIAGVISGNDVQTAIEQLEALVIASGGAVTVQNITANTGTIAAMTDIVYVNFAGAVSLNLADSTAWLAAHASRPSPLIVLDISGAASANNITINRAGADTINGLTSIVIASDYGGFRLRPAAAGIWTVQ